MDAINFPLIQSIQLQANYKHTLQASARAWLPSLQGPFQPQQQEIETSIRIWISNYFLIFFTRYSGKLYMRHCCSCKSHVILKNHISKIHTNIMSNYNLNNFHFQSQRKNKVMPKQTVFFSNDLCSLISQNVRSMRAGSLPSIPLLPLYPQCPETQNGYSINMWWMNQWMVGGTSAINTRTKISFET